MKVVGYAGSRSAFSKSICLGEKLKTMLREKNIEMELYTARNNVVEECRGCGKCFDEGLCPQDQEDSMEYIRKKILEADLQVFQHVLDILGILWLIVFQQATDERFAFRIHFSSSCHKKILLN